MCWLPPCTETNTHLDTYLNKETKMNVIVTSHQQCHYSATEKVKCVWLCSASGFKVPMSPLWSCGWCVGSTLPGTQTEILSLSQPLYFRSLSLSVIRIEYFPLPPSCILYLCYNVKHTQTHTHRQWLTGACSVPSSLSMLPLLFLDSVFCRKETERHI